MENTQKKTSALTPETAGRAAEKISGIIANVEKVIIGKRSVIELVVLALLSGGHVLIEDVPGVGKTSLAAAVAKSVDCGFQRIQFTPDLMPSDVTGFSVYNQKSGEFEFRRGAVMSNIVLADEINRASAKTQASLLEAMEEKQVTVDSHTYLLEEPFMVLATQNPLESYGTYPLPEAQMDRFLLKVSMGYPAFEEEVDVLFSRGSSRSPITAAASSEDIMRLRSLAEQVHMERVLGRYIVQIITAVRGSAEVLLGCSPRGGIALFRASKTWALMQGRDYVIPDDIRYLAPHILSHRILLNHEAKLQQRTPQMIVSDILSQIHVVLEREDEIDGVDGNGKIISGAGRERFDGRKKR